MTVIELSWLRPTLAHMSTPQLAHLQITQLTKSFGRGDRAKRALSNISLTVQGGEMVALLGASGSGKSTLLRSISGLHLADAGTQSRVAIRGEVLQEYGRLSPKTRQIRRRIATIFQQFNLVNRLSVLTNVCVGALSRVPSWRSLLGLFPRDVKLRAVDALIQVGIDEQVFKRARLLSGGQQQRVAIARAITQEADLILADEPIASLDPESSRKVMELLVNLNQRGCTVLVSLHQVAVALRYCQRVVALRDGIIVYDGPSASLTEQQIRELYGSDTDLIFDELEMTNPQQHASTRSLNEAYAS
jgi:phosphonate transport system ATP-binding protein